MERVERMGADNEIYPLPFFCLIFQGIKQFGADGADNQGVCGYIFSVGADVGFSSGYIFIDKKI